MLISDNSSAEETEQYVYAEGGLEYAYSSDTEVASVISYDGIAKDVKILSKITVDGVDYAVTSIAADVFKGKALESIVIEEGVTAIPASEFEGCTSLKSVTIPQSVTSIGESAFKGCTALGTVAITVSDSSADASRTIGASAFEGCTSLKTVSTHPSITYGAACFKNSGLESIKLYLRSFANGTVANITQAELFMGCDKLSKVELEYGDLTGLKFNAQSVFRGCTSLKTFPFPEGEAITSFNIQQSNVFVESGLESVYINAPNCTVQFAKWTFSDCKNLRDVTIDVKKCTTSATEVFKGCSLSNVYIVADSLALTQFVGATIDNLKISDGKISATTTVLGNLAINNIDLGLLRSSSNSGASTDDGDYVKLVSIPTLKKLTMSEKNAHYAVIGGGVYRLDYFGDDPTAPVALIICSPDVVSLSIPSTVTSVGASAFSLCKSLTEVSFPESLTAYAYAGTDVSFKDASGTAVGADVANFAGRTYMSKDGTEGLVLCPVLTFIADDKEVGKVIYTWDGKAVFPEVPAKTGFTGVWEDYSAVTEDKEIKAVYTQITFVDETNGVKYIVDEKGNAVVNEWIDSVKDVKILSKITVDGVDYAVTSIAADVFKGKAIESLVIEEGVTAIPASEFENCTALKTVSLPLSVSLIGEASFKGCSSLESVTIAVSDDSAVRSRGIGSSAFEDCVSLKSITTHPSLSPWTKINNQNFKSHCCFKNTGLESITIYLDSFGTTTGNVGRIGCNELFMNCSKLSTVNIVYGDAVVFNLAGNSMFEGCTSLKSFPFPTDESFSFDGIVGQSVFKNTGLESVTIGKSASANLTVGPCTFDGCTSLKTVVFNNRINFSGPATSNTTFSGCSIANMTLSCQSLDFRLFDGCSVDTLKLNDVQYVNEIPDTLYDKFTVREIDLGGLLSTSLGDDVSNDSKMAVIATIPGLQKITLTGENSKYGMVDGAVYRLDYSNVDAPTAPVALVICSPDVVSVEIPATVTSVGSKAFDGCDSLGYVSFPVGLTSFAYAGSDASFKDASGTAVGADVANFAGRIYMAKDGTEGLVLCPVLTFIADDKEVGKVTYTWDGKAVIPEVPAKTGFTGVWEDYPAVTGDKEIKAVYTPNKHTVTYMVNGTQFGDTETYDFGTEVIVKADYQKDGYESTPWSAEGIKVTDGKFVLGDADVVFSATSVMIVSAGTDGAAEIVLPVGETTFKPSEGTKTVTVKMAENTSVEIADAADLVGKVVVSEVKEITSTSGISGKAYEFTFTADGTQYNGKMEVTLPYTKENGKVPVVYFWDGSKSTEMKVLSSTDTSVTFETDHNSEYIVASEMLSSNGNSNEQSIPIIAVLIVVLIAIGGVFIIRRRRNA